MLPMHKKQCLKQPQNDRIWNASESNGSTNFDATGHSTDQWDHFTEQMDRDIGYELFFPWGTTDIINIVVYL